MTQPDNLNKLRQELNLLYMRYFGAMMAEAYGRFYANKDVETILHSAEGLFVEYAGETKGREIIEALKKKYKLTN